MSTMPPETRGQKRLREEEREREQREVEALKQLEIDQRNPMLNDVVLTRVFEFCKLSDLVKFQQVSKRWYAVAQIRRRRETAVTIYRRRRGYEIQDWYKFDRSPEKEFRNFHFYRPRFSSSATRYDLLMRLLWRKHGQWIRELRLTKCSIDCVESFKKVIFEDTPNLEVLLLNEPRWTQTPMGDVEEGEVANVKVNSNLKKLWFFMPRKPNAPFPISWRQIFAHFPNLRSLCISKAKNSYLALVVDALEEFCNNGNKLSLAEFSWVINKPLAGAVSKKFFELPGLELTTINIDLGLCENSQMSVLPTIIRCHGETLKSLALTYSKSMISINGWDRYELPHGFKPYIEFPFQSKPFINLTKINWDGYITPNLHFLELCPSLKRLWMVGCSEDIVTQTDWERLENLRLDNVKNFNFGFSSLPIPEEMMRTFLKWMPNLKHLSIMALAPSLRVVFENGKSLSSLSIYTDGIDYGDGDFPHVDDATITGIEEGREQRYPNITDLTSLRKLMIASDGTVRDGAVWDGFLKMPSLRDIEVEMSYHTSEEAMAALRKRFRNSDKKGKIQQLSHP